MNKQTPGTPTPLHRLTAAALLALAMQAAIAQSHSFNLPAQPLEQALAQFARQAGLQLAASPELLRGLRGQPVSGTLDAKAALAELLRGSGLQGRITDGLLTIERLAPQASAEPTLPTVRVVAPRDIGLRADEAPRTTKGSTPLIKTPMSVQVVPQALIEDRQANTLREALETVSGVFSGSTSLHEDIIVRGFPLYDTYRNGARTRRIGVTEMSNAERVDILKGPSSTQFGRGDVSGLFNVVTKKPQDEHFVAVQQQVGSHDFYQTQLDTTGPLNASKSLLYRVNLSYENAGSFRDNAGTDRIFVAPSLSWVPDAGTRVDLDLELSRDKSPIDRGIVAFGDRPADLPRNRSFSEDFTHHRNDVALLALNVSHRLDGDWTLRINAFAEQGRGEGLEYLQAADTPPGLFRMARRIEKRDIDHRFISVEAGGTPTWWNMRHDIVVGVDHTRRKGAFDFRYGDLESTPDLFNPAFPSGEPATPTQDVINNSGRSTGLYVQDQIALNDRFNLMLGARYDQARENMKNPGFASTASDDNKLSPRVGLVYTLAPGRSVYASYTQSFSDANNSSNGQSLKSIEAEQFEIGFKAETPDKRLFTAVAIYDLTKQNIVAPDPADSTRSIQIGEARSRGLEWDLGGRLTPHLNLTGSYSYTDAKVTRDTGGTEGNRLYGVPRHAGKLFARYDQQSGGAQGLSAGIGLVALGSQQGDTANSFQIPGYARVDLMGSYKWRTPGFHWAAQLNVVNVGDKTYYLPSGARDEIAYGKPLTIFAALRVTH